MRMRNTRGLRWEERMAEHTCHARGCGVPIPLRMAMCRRHWRMVPKLLQMAVWAWYVPGQEVRKDPTPEYLEALRAAIDVVAEKERGAALGGEDG